MKKPINNLILVIIAAFCVTGLFNPVKAFAQYGGNAYQQPQNIPSVKAKLAGTDFDVMLARTNQEKMKGFMFFWDIPETTAMLFVYNYDHQMHFWMKNTRIPLDIVFFSSDLKVVEWIENMQPGYGKYEASLPHYSSKGKARHALELKAGMIKKLGIKVGDRLEIPLIMLYSE